jgi:hypothetical protein
MLGEFCVKLYVQIHSVLSSLFMCFYSRFPYFVLCYLPHMVFLLCLYLPCGWLMLIRILNWGSCGCDCEDCGLVVNDAINLLFTNHLLSWNSNSSYNKFFKIPLNSKKHYNDSQTLACRIYFCGF